MALHFDARNVEGFKDIPSGLKDAVIMGTMCVDMGSITEKNVTEFTARAMMHQMIYGAWMGTVDGAYYVTEEDIRRFIGLSVNVSTTTPAAWSKRIAKAARESVTSPYGHGRRMMEKATQERERRRVAREAREAQETADETASTSA